MKKIEDNEMARKNRKPNKIVQQILDEYNPETVEDMQDALKDVFGPMFEAMLNGEMDHHLGYEKNSRADKEGTNRRNGYGNKSVKTSTGEVEIDVPRDREGSFEPKLIKKRQRDVSGIESKVLSMYGKGMSQRDIADTIEDIYGFEISAEQISKITDRVLDEANEWQNRPLKSFYPFVFVDCMYVSVRKEYEIKNYAVYAILGYDSNGKKEILGIWLNETESKHVWMQIFDEIKQRGVEDILFVSIDGVSGLEAGIKSIYPKAKVQRCIVHLIRNSLKYIPSKDYKAYTSNLKRVYGAPSLKAAEKEFEQFKQNWSQYPGATDVWIRHWSHVEQLFNYGSAVRKVMYTTNAIESVNSSFRKVIKKGTFPNENALIKALYLRIKELDKKWEKGRVQNWAMVRNQLIIKDEGRKIIEKHSKFD